MQLDEIQSRRDNDQLTEEDTTDRLALLELSDLSDFDRLIRFGNGAGDFTTTLCIIVLDNALGACSNSEILRSLRTNATTKLRTGLKRNLFATYVKDNHDSALVELEERSKVFRNGFSLSIS